MRTRKALLASAAVISLLAATPLAAIAAPVSAPKAVGKYFALEGSGTHLLFAAKKTSKPLDLPAANTSRQYVLNAKGVRTAVPAGYDAFLIGDDPLFRKEVVTKDLVTEVRWIRPDHHTSGKGFLPEGSTLETAASNGWVIRLQIGNAANGPLYGLRRVSTDGTQTDLGTPAPDGRQFGTRATPTGLLIESEESDDGNTASGGTVQFMPWSTPGSYRRLWPAAGATPQLGTEFDCSSFSSKLVRCIIGLEEGIVRLLPVDGSKPIALAQRCARLFPAVRTTAVAWTDSDTYSGCKPGRVEQRTIAGKLTISTRRYSRLQQPVTAFGKLVVATSTQRHLVTISNPTSTPKQIVGNGAG